jgi:hypothetical protein
VSDPDLAILLRTSRDTTGEVQRVLSKLEASGRDLKIHRVIANATHVFRSYVKLAEAMMTNEAFPAADREVLILHLAARRGVGYEWAEHVSISERAGITEQERGLLRAGDLEALSPLTPSQRLAAELGSEIVDSGSLTASSWDAACAMWGSDGAMSLILAVAFWGAFIPTVIEAVGLRTPAPAPTRRKPTSGLDDLCVGQAS